MKVLYRKLAFINDEKFTKYLINSERPKGKYFRSNGFNETNIKIFKERLLKIVHNEEVQNMMNSDYGRKYTIEGDLRTPNGKIVKVLTVWIIEKNHKKPSFVTTYPV